MKYGTETFEKIHIIYIALLNTDFLSNYLLFIQEQKIYAEVDVFRVQSDGQAKSEARKTERTYIYVWVCAFSPKFYRKFLPTAHFTPHCSIGNNSLGLA